MNLLLPKPPDRPTFNRSGFGETNITSSYFRERMPIITVGLDNQSSRLEHKVGLPPPEHGSMHLEAKPTLFELIKQHPFNRSHRSRETLTKARLPRFLSFFRARPSLAGTLAHPFSCFKRERAATHCLSVLGRFGFAQVGLAYFLSRLWRMFTTNPVFVAKFRLAYAFTTFRRCRTTFQCRLPHLFSIVCTQPYRGHRLLPFKHMIWGLLFALNPAHLMFNYTTKVKKV